MKRNQAGYFNMNLGGMFIALLGFGSIIGALLMWLVPAAWAWIKPLIHAITA